eukprot:CAMPEP_0184986900 /NCGR_PEP_ID=MMETSP1098-20130426/18445_1 /TAXON_ID=89044 /ORGANISM="Spumella elongata, Strain CCAP 955/1" /LENGTH=124 /DNA_ID=CAMNT_0027511285 /DNA_START=54 /DNA_END=428 /DNA_ORIENTATION=-
MAPKVPRHVATDLIKYAKKLDIIAYAFNSKHKSAVAFCEQMSSPKLYKLNPNYEVTFEWHQEPKPSIVRAEFINGLKWETCADDKTLADLRHEFFEQAAIVDEEADEGDEPVAAAKPATGGKKK